ncbi:DNA polymerase subunit Cdc27 [Xylaria arbuscula]|nr:DNA polymerase subunit Cdc27 [Xylaria arbuscula]
MEDYKQYLAQKILTEDQVVTYRLLSRALKIHVNTAKEMLYDFHKWQNDIRPNSMYATYIIYGVKSRQSQQDGDVEMTDSQMSEVDGAPFSDLVPTFTMSLVRQEQLQESLSQFSEVDSIHVYSLAPYPLKDLQILTDVARQVRETLISDGLPDPSKVYGTVANKNVRKRERRRGPVPVAQKAPQPKIETKAPVKLERKPAAVEAPVKEEPKEAPKPAAAPAPARKPTPAAPLKRQGSSGIGQMFAKQAAKPKKPAAKPAVEENQAMSDDGEDDAEPTPGPAKNEEDSSARQARKDRQAELQRMMEESDDEEAEPENKKAEEEDPMDEEPEPEPEPVPEPKAEEPAEVVSSTSGGRRRGRRRVVRKKQIMDEKGYLVTIQEPGWESFSEDEAPPAPAPAPKAKLPLQQNTAKSEPASKGKKGGAGAGKGQGNIMSFFSKK